jgi:hypothetical protein
MRRERRNHAIARKCPRAGIDTEALPSSTNGPRTRAGRLAGWRRHATGCDGRGAATQEKEAQSGRTRAPILVLFLDASRLSQVKSSQVKSEYASY